MRAPTVVYGRMWRHLRPAHDRWNPQTKARWKSGQGVRILTPWSGVLFFNQVEVEDIVVDMLEVDIIKLTKKEYQRKNSNKSIFIYI